MFAEFTIAIIAVIVCATAFADSAAYIAKVSNPVGIFVGGLGGAITSLGLPVSYAKALAGMMIIILALTIINLVFRFMKVATAELLGDTWSVAKNPHVATIVALIITFVLVKTGTWLYVWVLFGGANQLMASLALLVVSVWLVSQRRNATFTLIPMVFMFATTVGALCYTSYSLLSKVRASAAGGGELSAGDMIGNVLMAIIAIFLVIAALLLAYDGLRALIRLRRAPPTEEASAPA